MSQAPTQGASLSASGTGNGALSFESVFLAGQAQGAVVMLYETERPLQGFAGKLDWRLHGRISRLIEDGAFSGAAGECIYLPENRWGRVFHLLLVGGGTNAKPGERGTPPAKSLRIAQKNLLGLKLGPWAVSAADFGTSSQDALKRLFQGVPIVVLP